MWQPMVYVYPHTLARDPKRAQACGGAGEDCGHRRRTAIGSGRTIPPSLGVFIQAYIYIYLYIYMEIYTHIYICIYYI